MENLILRSVGKNVNYVREDSVQLRCASDTYKMLAEVRDETKLPMWAIIHEMIKYAYEHIDYTR